MSSLHKPSRQKRARRDEAPTGRPSRKRQRAQSLSPLGNEDEEEAPRTREKIIAELRKELAAAKTEAAEATLFKKQRDFAVHVAAGFCDLQREMFVGWYTDVQKLTKTPHFKDAQAGRNRLFDRAEAIEKTLKNFPKLDRSLRARVGVEELEQIKGCVEDFGVEMVERDDSAADSASIEHGTEKAAGTRG
jgi:hypothetical protein